MAEKSKAQNQELSNVDETQIIAVPQGGYVDLSELGLSPEEIATLSGLDNATNDFRIPYATLVSKDTKEHKKGVDIKKKR